MNEAKLCSSCNRLIVPRESHGISPSEASAFGAKRCRMCGIGAIVRCVFGPNDFWVECPRGHLSRVT